MPEQPQGALSRPFYGSAFRGRYMDCPDTGCLTMSDHASHDPHGPQYPDGLPYRPTDEDIGLVES